MKRQYSIAIAVIIIAAALAGAGYLHQKQVAQDISDNASVTTLVTQFGQQMQKVSLSAPDALEEIASNYAPYATPELVKSWQDNHSFAPGRGVSSPWPDRIEIISVTKNGDGTYTAQGNVIEITSQEVAHGGIAAEFPVTLTAKKVSGSWLIANYQAGPEQVFSNSTTTATTTSH